MNKQQILKKATEKMEKLLSHYSPEFRTLLMDFYNDTQSINSWVSAEMSKLNKSKTK